MDFISYIVIGLISVATLFYWYIKESFSYWKRRNVPHLKPIFPYGNVKGIGTVVHPARGVQEIYNRLKGSGKFCGFYFFIWPKIILLDLELIRNILIKDFSNFSERDLYYNEKDDPISAHLVALDGDKWKKLRSKLSPTFTSGKMKFMFPTFVEVGQRFQQCLKEIVEQNNELEVKDLMSRLTTDIIATCAFGIDSSSLKDPNAEFRQIGRAIYQKQRHHYSVSMLIRHFKRLSKMLGVKIIHDDITNFFMRIVTDTVEYREKNNISRNDFMDLLINLKNDKNDKTGNLTINEIAAQTFIFFLGGFETSSSTLTCCLYELAINPAVQTKTREEIKNTLNKCNGKLTYEAIMDMPYVDQVIKGNLVLRGQ